VEGGNADVNKKAARVFRGVVIPGVVTEFIPLSSHVVPPAEIADDTYVETEDTWKVMFDDEAEYIYGKKELNEAFKCYAEYNYQKARSKAMKEEAKAVKEEENGATSSGKIDTSNIIAHKRGRNSIDYVSLSLEMFGDVSDDDDEDHHEEDSPQYKKRRGRPSKVHSTSSSLPSSAVKAPAPVSSSQYSVPPGVHSSSSSSYPQQHHVQHHQQQHQLPQQQHHMVRPPMVNNNGHNPTSTGHYNYPPPAEILAARALNEANAHLNLAVMDDITGAEI